MHIPKPEPKSKPTLLNICRKAPKEQKCRLVVLAPYIDRKEKK